MASSGGKKSAAKTCDPITSSLTQTSPTLLEGVCMAREHIMPLSPEHNAQLADLAHNGGFQAIFALNVPACIFNPMLGSFGSIRDGVTMNISMDATNLKKQETITVPAAEVRQLLTFMLMLPLAPVDLFNAEYPAQRVQYLAKIQDEVFGKEGSCGTPWSDILQTSYQQDQVNVGLGWCPVMVEEVKEEPQQDKDDKKKNNNNKTANDDGDNTTRVYRFWMFVPMSHGENVCRAMQHLLESIAIRSEIIKANRLAVADGKTSKKKKKKKQPKKKKGASAMDMIVQQANEEAVEGDPAAGDDSTEGGGAEDGDDPDGDELPVIQERAWEHLLLNTIYSEDLLRAKRAAAINKGQEHCKFVVNVDGGGTVVVHGHQPMDIVDPGGGGDKLLSLDDVFRMTDEAIRMKAPLYDDYETPAVLFERTGYATYQTSPADMFRGNRRFEPPFFGIPETNDAYSIFHPSRLWAPAMAMTSWCSATCCPTQRDYRSYFDVFDEGADGNLTEDDLIKEPQAWLRTYIKRHASDIQSWPSATAALGWAIHHRLSKGDAEYTPVSHGVCEAKRFRGFPTLVLNRIHVLSPLATLPWRFGMMPHPIFLREFPAMNRSIKALSQWDNFFSEDRMAGNRKIMRNRTAIQTEYEGTRLSLQVLAGLSLDPLAKTAKGTVQIASILPPKIPTPSSVLKQRRLQQEHSSSCHDIMTVSELNNIVAVAAAVLVERYRRLASSQSPTDILQSAIYRGFNVTGQVPNHIAIPSLDLSADTTVQTVADQGQKITQTDLRFLVDTNIFLHLREISDHLKTFREMIVPDPTASPLHRAVHARLVSESNNLMEHAFSTVIEHYAAMPMSGPVQSALKYFHDARKDVNLLEAWPYYHANNYENLSIVGEETNWLAVAITEIYQIHSNLIQTMVLRDAFLTASRWTPSTATQFPNVLLPGPAGGGKSVAIKAVVNASIPGTTMEMAALTNRAFNIQGNNDDNTYYTEEAGSNIFGGKNANNDLVVQFKQRCECGRIGTLCFDNSDATMSGGAVARTSRLIINSCQGANILATNEDLTYADKALLSRFIILNIGHVDERNAPPGWSLQDRALQGPRDAEADRIHTNYATSIRLQHLHVMLVYKMIQAGVLPNVEMSDALDAIACIFGHLKDKIGQGGAANRLMGHIRIYLATEVIRKAVYSVHAQGLVDDYKYDAMGHVRPYDLAILYREVPKYLFADKETVIRLLTMFRDILDRPLRTDIMQALAKQAYPNGSLEKAKFWKRPVERSKEDKKKAAEAANANTHHHHMGPLLGSNMPISGMGNRRKDMLASSSSSSSSASADVIFKTDLNYIVIRLNGTTREQAMQSLGDSLLHIKMSKAQVNVEIQSLSETKVMLSPNVDQNQHEVPDLGATPPHSHRGGGEDPILDEMAIAGYANGLHSEEFYDSDLQLAAPPKPPPSPPRQQQIPFSDDSNLSISDAQAAEIARRVDAAGAAVAAKLPPSPPVAKGANKKKKKADAAAAPVVDHSTSSVTTPPEDRYPAVNQPTEVNVLVYQHDQVGPFIAIFEPYLRRYYNLENTTKEKSALLKAIDDVLSVESLEFYPQEAINVIDNACGGLSPCPSKYQTFREWHQNTQVFEYITGINETSDEMTKIRQEMPQLPQNWRVHKFLHTVKLQRNPDRLMRLYNFTAPLTTVKVHIPTEKHLTDELLKKAQEGRTRIIKYDLDWIAYERNCERLGQSNKCCDPDWLKALPRFTKLFALSKLKAAPARELYPIDPLREVCRLLKSDQEESELVKSIERERALKRKTATNPIPAPPPPQTTTTNDKKRKESPVTIISSFTRPTTTTTEEEGEDHVRTTKKTKTK